MIEETEQALKILTFMRDDAFLKVFDDSGLDEVDDCFKNFEIFRKSFLEAASVLKES